MEPLVLSGRRAEREAFLAEVGRLAETEVRLCYQCGKCSAGCPVSPDMDLPPHKLMRLLQLGLGTEALQADSLWLCTSCHTCSSRCPRNVRVDAVLEVLRHLAAPAREGSSIVAFHRSFLDSIYRRGRLDEIQLTISLKRRTGGYLKDAGLGLQLFRKGRLGLGHRPIRGVVAVRRLLRPKGGD